MPNKSSVCVIEHEMFAEDSTDKKVAIVPLVFMLNSDAIVRRMKYGKAQNGNYYSTEAWNAPQIF